MSEQEKPTDINLNLRLPVDLHHWLKEYVQSEQRSINGQIILELQALRRRVAGEQPSIIRGLGSKAERLQRLHDWAEQQARNSLLLYNVLHEDVGEIGALYDQLSIVVARLAALRLATEKHLGDE